MGADPVSQFVEILSDTQHKKIILFDGVCNLCNSAVNFIIDRDIQDCFVFAPLQSRAGQRLLAQFSLPEDYLHSLILIEEGKIYQKSTAALHIARRLIFPWSMLYVFLAVPVFFRDWIYQLIAKYRYKIFGKSPTCRYPSEDIKKKFLADIN